MMKSSALYMLMPPKTAIYDQTGILGKGGMSATASENARLEVLF
jgi:hypothetical protein